MERPHIIPSQPRTPDYKNVRVLVTGADGFIGSHLTERLVLMGADVTALALYNSFDSVGWLDQLPADAGEPERQQVSPLRRHQRMQLVENDVFQVLEEALRLLVGQQQRHLFRRRQQDVGRSQLLALSLCLRRIAGAVLDADRQAHLRDGLHQVAFYIDG